METVDRPVAAVRRDQVTLGVLVAAVPRHVIDAAVTRHGVGPKRDDGKLPAHVTVGLTLGLCLFSDEDYEEVATLVTGSLAAWGCWNAAWSVPTSSGITQARKRVGKAVMADIFTGIATPVATAFTRGARLRRWRLTAIDGFEVDLFDSEDNAAEFGYAGRGDNRSAFPKARVSAISECGTHAYLDAEIDPYAVGEKTQAQRLFTHLRPDELLTADRNFYSFTGWATAAATGAALLWRAPTDLGLPLVRVLDDGTYLALLINPQIRSTARRERLLADAADGIDIDPATAHLVRIIEYDVPDRTGSGTGELIVLLTTITDPTRAGADELAAAYHERWEHESANDELKTHLRGPGKVLRSRLPDLVYQELWAYLIVHYAISALITQAAEAADLDPDRISYTKALRIIRRTAKGTAAFPPSGMG